MMNLIEIVETFKKDEKKQKNDPEYQAQLAELRSLCYQLDLLLKDEI